MSFVTDIDDGLFEEKVVKSDIPVLVDFWAEWCTPCKIIAPLLEQIAEEFKDKVKIYKINIEINPNTPAKYNVRGIPTLMLFKNGNIEATKVGSLNKTQLQEFLNSVV